MRICFILHNLQMGGAEQYTLTLCRGLTTRGFLCEIHTIMGSGALESEVPQGVQYFPHTFIRMPKARLLRRIVFLLFLPIAIVRLAKVLRQRQPDIVHTALVYADIVGIIAARISGIRSILSTQQDQIYPAGRQKRFSLQWAQRIVATSDTTREFLIARLQVPRDKIVLIRNGIAGEQFRSARAFPFIKPLKIAMIGRFHPHKGQRILLEALVLLQKQGLAPPTTLLGSGQDKEAIIDFIQRERLDHVVLLSEQNNTINVLRKADIVVVPSLTEGFGLVVLEGMAAGKAVIASRVGGIPDLITDGSNGLLFSPGDAVDLADRLRTLLADPTRAMELGERAYRFFDENPDFSVEGMVEKYIALYQSIAGGKSD